MGAELVVLEAFAAVGLAEELDCMVSVYSAATGQVVHVGHVGQAGQVEGAALQQAEVWEVAVALLVEVVEGVY